VLHLLADELDRPIRLPDVATVRAEIAGLGAVPQRGDVAAADVDAAAPGEGEALLSTWHLLLDDGSLQDGEPHLAGTAKAPVALLGATTAARLGLVEGDPLTVSSDRGSTTLPLRLADLPDGVVWLPTRSGASHVRADLAAAHGSPVRLSKGGAA
jgi:NADH-quinone oxidoreductase subunit G